MANNEHLTIDDRITISQMLKNRNSLKSSVASSLFPIFVIICYHLDFVLSFVIICYHSCQKYTKTCLCSCFVLF